MHMEQGARVRELKDQAAESFRRQRYREAAAALEQLLQLDPNDIQSRLRLGDSFRRLGESGRALGSYHQAARRYAEAGQSLKAISAYKLALELEPEHQAVRLELEQVTLRRFAGAVRRPAQDSIGTALSALVQERGPEVDPAISSITPLPGTLRPVRPAPPPRPPPTLSAPGKRGFGPVATKATDQFLPAFPAALAAPPLDAPIPLFEELPPKALLAFLTRMVHRICVEGEAIVEQGAPGQSLFLLVEGSAQVRRREPDGRELELARLGEGAFFGEMALLSGAPRLASVIALEQTVVLEISERLLRELVEQHPAVANTLKRVYRERLLENAGTLSPLFAGRSPEERAAMLGAFKMRQAIADHIFLQEGLAADGVYLILHGQVRIQRLEGSRQVEVGRLGEGALFGLSAMKSGRAPGASVVALGPVVVLKLAASSFAGFCQDHPLLLELGEKNDVPLAPEEPFIVA